jgi:hypothetical protein
MSTVLGFVLVLTKLLDHYIQATATLLASLSANPQSLKPIVK